MKTVNEVVTFITSPAMVLQLAAYLRENDPEFPQLEEHYQEALACLEANYTEETGSDLEAYIKACQTLIVADLLFAAYAGYRANLDNYHSACTTNFFRMDFSDYIREHLMGYSPAALEARRIQSNFEQQLPASCDEAIAAISEYFIALDVAGPKIAHYAGYILANALLPWVEPGYREDPVQTLLYRHEIMKYIGKLPHSLEVF